MSFKIGERILCVDDVVRSGRRKGLKHRKLNAGDVYTCRGLPQWINPDDDSPTVAVEESPNIHDGVEIGFYADRFRPIDDPRLEIFRALCRTKPKVTESQE